MSMRLPLAHACSGCPSAAQMANHPALKPNRKGRAPGCRASSAPAAVSSGGCASDRLLECR
jgi:uncharacterized metal-binding protein